MSELNFLKVLKLQIESPTLDFLCRVLQQHQCVVPYENLSKLIRSAAGDFTIPSFLNYVHDIKNFGYGRTCFAQNIYLQQLLNFLGFSTEMHGNWVDGKITHPSLVIRIDDKNYCVDLGIMSTFVGPFELDLKHNFTKQIGNQTYEFASANDCQSSHLKIFRQGKMIRELKNTEPVPTQRKSEQAFYKHLKKQKCL